MTELPYYRVVLMPGRRWAVVHRVPGTGVDAVDLEFATLRAAQSTCAGMNEARHRCNAECA